MDRTKQPASGGRIQTIPISVPDASLHTVSVRLTSSPAKAIDRHDVRARDPSGLVFPAWRVGPGGFDDIQMHPGQPLGKSADRESRGNGTASVRADVADVGELAVDYPFVLGESRQPSVLFIRKLCRPQEISACFPIIAKQANSDKVEHADDGTG